MPGLIDTRLSSSDDQSQTTNNNTTNITTINPVDNSAISGDVGNRLALTNSGGANVTLVDAGTVNAMKELVNSGLTGVFKSQERTVDTAQNTINKAMELAKGNSSAQGLEMAKTIGAVAAIIAAIYFLPDVVNALTGKNGRSKAHA